MDYRCKYCKNKAGRRNLYCKKHYTENITISEFLFERNLFIFEYFLDGVLVPYKQNIFIYIINYETTYAAVALFNQNKKFVRTDENRTIDYLYNFGDEYKIITCRGIANGPQNFAIYGKDTKQDKDINILTLNVWSLF
jgi:hypothetical protein